MNIFKDSSGAFSWRKALTCISGLIFAYAVIGYLYGLRKLPTAYIIIISGVFTFYFTKEVFTKKKE